jgi:hypothetical protein
MFCYLASYRATSPGTESASSVQRFIRGMPRAFAFANADNHRSQGASPTSEADVQYNVANHNNDMNADDSELVATFGHSRNSVGDGTPVSDAGALKSQLRYCSCRRSLCLKASYPHVFSPYFLSCVHSCTASASVQEGCARSSVSATTVTMTLLTQRNECLPQGTSSNATQPPFPQRSKRMPTIPV